MACCLWGKNSSMGSYLLMMALSFDMFAELMLAEINWDCIYRKRWRIELGQKKYLVNSLVARKIIICTLTHYLGYGTNIFCPLCHREFSYSSQYNFPIKWPKIISDDLTSWTYDFTLGSSICHLVVSSQELGTSAPVIFTNGVSAE